MGAGYRNLATWLLVPGLTDLTCGMKGLRAGAAVAVFGPSRIPRFGFDLEILFIARRLGMSIREVPVDWSDDPDSRVSQLARSHRSFRLLEELGTAPAVIYLKGGEANV